ncbi:class I SAM-dependent methyltransferase [Verrucomicrobia bacterium]|nr:class I SAM-dependent methyltransferase [Verrucomicrobiota bacterium]
MNLDKANFKNSLKPEGKVTCNECESVMPFVNGVLIAGKRNWTQNQKRNAYVYSDFWERSDEAIKYQRVTHEDELIELWRKSFGEGVLLDAGCGSGRHLSHWTQTDVKADSFVMVDISDSIFQCRRYYEKINCAKPVIFIQSSVNEMPIKKQSISSTWSSGVVGLLEDQQHAIQELCRVSQRDIILGVLTEKTIAGKIYIAANLVKPFLNKVKNMKLLFMLSGLMARGAILMLKLLNFVNLPLSFIRKEHLNNILNDPNAIVRLQHSLYDPIIIPRIIKHPDSKYVEWGEKYDFKLKAHQTEIICDYFHFNKR